MANNKSRKKVKRLTLSELKTYIEGAIEFNPPEWCPNKEQWDQIVEMIKNVKEDSPKVVPSQSETAPEPVRPAQVEAVPSQLDTGIASEPVRVQQSTMTEGEPSYDRLPNHQRLDASRNPAARPQVERMGEGMGEKDPSTGAVSSGLRFKTPNVDTSQKPYESGFK